MKNVQISEELFTRLCAYHILDKRDPLQEQIIRDGLQDKLDRITARKEYIPGKNIYRERKHPHNRGCEFFNQGEF